ncbi:MAG: adenylosuccinate synthetase, partial [Bryobacterales bacterium]|nr:adenylosuccinate synthetase [Bryobacterales bacterium]
ARRGIRGADLLDADNVRQLFVVLSEDKQTFALEFQIDGQLDYAKIRAEYEAFAERIRPMVCDASRLLNDAIQAGQRILFEGAQGTMLDIDHGTYPFVTSSSAAAGGACTGAGVPPTRISGVLGVSKAYTTRVGGGPFPTEDHGATGERIRKAGNEFGAVTGRPRRCGWFDVPLLRYTAMVNGFDSLVITKLDVLDEFPEIQVCTGYRVNGRVTDEVPATSMGLEAVEPVYETLPGWTGSTRGATSYDALPDGAKRYLDFLSREVGVEIGCISTGPERNETILLPGSRFEQLVG